MPLGMAKDLAKLKAIFVRGKDGHSIYGDLLIHDKTSTCRYPEERFR